MSQLSDRLPHRGEILSRRSFSVLLVAQAVLLNSDAFAQSSADGARAFMQKIYASYIGKDATGLNYRGHEDRYFSPELLPLFKKYAKTYEKEPGGLDFDIFMAAQDWDRPKVDISIEEKGENRVRATATIVVFAGMKDKSIVTYDLVKIGDNWRIENMRWRGMKDNLVDILKQL